MERIELRYEFSNESDKSCNTFHAENVLTDKDGCGLSIDEICENFVEFMESAGFPVNKVYNYFRE